MRALPVSLKPLQPSADNVNQTISIQYVKSPAPLFPNTNEASRDQQTKVAGDCGPLARESLCYLSGGQGAAAQP